MTIIRSFVLALLVLAASASPSAAQELLRRTTLGVAFGPVDGGGPGVLVTGVLPGQTAEAIGVRSGDVIVRAGGRAIAAVPDVGAFVSGLQAGQPVELVVRRDGRVRTLRGRARALPFEQWQGARADYGAVPWRGGLLRDIMVTPDGAPADAPVLFLIQGFSCTSAESVDTGHPYRRLGAELVPLGIAYYRVEKPWVGDSRGGARCQDIDFAAEVDAFRAAYRHLVEVRGVDPDRIFIFGHSLGGIQAPLLAAERAPRGIAVFGTGLRSWADYHRDLLQFQPFLMGGADPVEWSATTAQDREMLRRFYFMRQAPAQIAAEVPELAARMREVMLWDGGDRMLGRHFKFMQDLAHLPLIAAWRDSRTNVLAMYGESDFAALWDEDHRMIVDIANHYRPGSGRFVEFPRTGHGMQIEGTRAEVRARNIAGTAASELEFNRDVPRTVAAWIRESMSSAPLRTLPQPERPAPPTQGS